MSPTTARSTLKLATAALVIAGGLLLVMASHPVTAILPNLFFDLAFLPFDGVEKASEPVSRLLGAIGGGGLTGLGVTFWLIITKLMPREPDLARAILTSGLLSWFTIDSFGSVLSGAYFNVAMNSVILACFLIPLKFVNERNEGN